jgi:hypothetical protein
MKPQLKAPGTKRLTVKCDEPLSSFAFKFSLRRYSKGMRPWEAEGVSRTLVELDSIYGDVELLAVKFDRLARTLPGVDIKSMVAKDPKVGGCEVRGAAPCCLLIRVEASPSLSLSLTLKPVQPALKATGLSQSVPPCPYNRRGAHLISEKIMTVCLCVPVHS